MIDPAAQAPCFQRHHNRSGKTSSAAEKPGVSNSGRSPLSKDIRLHARRQSFADRSRRWPIGRARPDSQGNRRMTHGPAQLLDANDPAMGKQESLPLQEFRNWSIHHSVFVETRERGESPGAKRRPQRCGGQEHQARLQHVRARPGRRKAARRTFESSRAPDETTGCRCRAGTERGRKFSKKTGLFAARASASPARSRPYPRDEGSSQGLVSGMIFRRRQREDNAAVPLHASGDEWRRVVARWWLPRALRLSL